MKIGVISYAFYPRMSGVGNVVRSLYSTTLKNHPELIETVRVLAYNEGGLNEYETFEGLKIIRFKTPTLLKGRIPLIGLDFLKKAWNFIDKKNIDQLHIHTRFSTTSIFCLLIAKFKGVKVYHYEHLGDYIRGEGFLVNTLSYLWDQTISRVIFTLSDKIIVVSNSIQDFLKKDFGINENKIAVLENGCDFKAVEQSFSNKFKDKKHFNILFASRLVPLKNPMLTLKAIKKLREMGVNNFTFTMAGAGKLQSEVESFIENEKMSEYAKFVGKLNLEQMGETMKNTDILVNCSLLEGFPGVVIEAIFNNVIPMVTNVCGNKDIVTNKESLIDVIDLNEENLALKLKDLIEKAEEIAIKLEETKQHFSINNSWDKVSERLLKIIK
jgi:glycosyltransferase involved in cell wall biosynthesis